MHLFKTIFLIITFTCFTTLKPQRDLFQDYVKKTTLGIYLSTLMVEAGLLLSLYGFIKAQDSYLAAHTKIV